MVSSCLTAEFESDRDFETAVEVLGKSYGSRFGVSTVSHSSEKSLSELERAKDEVLPSPPGDMTTAATKLAGGPLVAALGTIFWGITLTGSVVVTGPNRGLAAGAVGGSLLCAIESWGIDHDLASDYESKVCSGLKLVIVRADDARVAEAKRAPKTAGPMSLEMFLR